MSDDSEETTPTDTGSVTTRISRLERKTDRIDERVQAIYTLSNNSLAPPARRRQLSIQAGMTGLLLGLVELLHWIIEVKLRLP